MIKKLVTLLLIAALVLPTICLAQKKERTPSVSGAVCVYNAKLKMWVLDKATLNINGCRAANGDAIAYEAIVNNFILCEASVFSAVDNADSLVLLLQDGFSSGESCEQRLVDGYVRYSADYDASTGETKEAYIPQVSGVPVCTTATCPRRTR